METLIIKNVTLNDTGLYTCWTGNVYGTNYRSAYVTVVPGEDTSYDASFKCCQSI